MSGLEELLTGRTLVKRYRIQEVIGRGGFAAVYRAEDERLGRPVAVKVITLVEQDREAAARHRERFEREAKAAASLPQHPNVVTVHDFGVDPVLGIDFLVMEFLHGEDLATRLRRAGRLPLQEAMRVLREAAAGIAVGHRAGVVHRDVKPGNIFLAQVQPGEPERVCVLDFGIAQLLTEDQTLALQPGEGTPLSPAYASPEQSRGSAEITSASDVFSLGVVGFQLLTGEKPFAPQRGMDPAEWVPVHAVRQLNPEVPVAVEAVVNRALAFEPRERFADAEDFGAALAAALTGESTVLMPPASPAAAGAAVDSAPSAVPAGEVDRTLFQPPPVPEPRGRQRIAYGEPPARERPRRRGGGLALLLLLLLLAGGAGAWWYLSRGSDGEPTYADPGASEDLEAIQEGLEAEGEVVDGPEEPDVVAAPPSGESRPTTVMPPQVLPPGAIAPGSIPPGAITPGTFPPTPAQGDTATAPAAQPQPVEPEPEPVPADTSAPPPRVIGVPVDSVDRGRAPPSPAASGPTSSTASPDA